MKSITHLYKNPKTFVQWLGGEKYALENNSKPERLKILNDLIGLPYDKNYDFSINECKEISGKFVEFYKQYKKRLCVIRLIAKGSRESWQRIRGLTVEKSLEWLKQRDLSNKNLFVQFALHSEKPLWSIIFVVNKTRIIGEIIRGGHYQLTRGLNETGVPMQFVYDYSKWKWSAKDTEAEKMVKRFIGKVKTDNIKTQYNIKKLMTVEFHKGYLEGYFESTLSSDMGLSFGDYNRLLTNFRKNIVSGLVRIVNSLSKDLNKGEILVSLTTNPDLLPLMVKAKAIITEQGGILSHAAIVAREFGIPCIVGVQNATEVLKDGDKIEIDAPSGLIYKYGEVILRGVGTKMLE